MISILVDAVIISIILYGGIFLMIKINPRSQLHNYPEPIRKAVPEKNKEDKRVAVLVGLPVFIALIAYIILSSYYRFHGSDIMYWQILSRWFAVFLLTDAFDLFICDYLIFCTITPEFIIIPGTNGNPAYKDKAYHTKSIPHMILIALILSLLTSLTYFLV